MPGVANHVDKFLNASTSKWCQIRQGTQRTTLDRWFVLYWDLRCKLLKWCVSLRVTCVSLDISKSISKGHLIPEKGHLNPCKGHLGYRDIETAACHYRVRPGLILAFCKFGPTLTSRTSGDYGIAQWLNFVNWLISRVHHPMSCYIECLYL